MNTWRRMHLLLKIGLIVDVMSIMVVFARVVFDGPYIMIPIQIGLLGVAVIFIGVGAFKMRRAYYEYKE